MSRRAAWFAVMGDAELDEGNVFEALLEGWKHDVRNLWWIIDYNRQSLDSIATEFMFPRVDDVFRTTGWNVTILKYGKRLQAAFGRRGGDALRQWIDDCPNSLYSALTFKGGPSWREHLRRDLGDTGGFKELLDDHDDEALHELMTNLAGHDMESILEGFDAVRDDRPHCFITYTIKGWGLPFAGHKDNHAGIMNPEQMATYQQSQRIAAGQEWEPFAGLEVAVDTLRDYLARVPFAHQDQRQYSSAAVAVPATLDYPRATHASTQEAFRPHPQRARQGRRRARRAHRHGLA